MPELTTARGRIKREKLSYLWGVFLLFSISCQEVEIVDAEFEDDGPKVYNEITNNVNPQPPPKPRLPKREKITTHDTYNVRLTDVEGLTKVAGIDCEKPINRVWPKFEVHIPNHYKTGTRAIKPRSVEVEVLTSDGEVLRAHTMLNGQKNARISVHDIRDRQPLSLRLTQVFDWHHGKKSLSSAESCPSNRCGSGKLLCSPASLQNRESGNKAKPPLPPLLEKEKADPGKGIYRG